MTDVDLIGFVASVLVFMTFAMKDMVALRITALCSNVAFLIYAFSLHLLPIAILHGALLPMNAMRLIGALRAAPRATMLQPRRRRWVLTDGFKR